MTRVPARRSDPCRLCGGNMKRKLVFTRLTPDAVLIGMCPKCDLVV